MGALYVVLGGLVYIELACRGDFMGAYGYKVYDCGKIPLRGSENCLDKAMNNTISAWPPPPKKLFRNKRN